LPSETTAKYLVLVSIDACRPDYFPLATIPNITKLMNEGASYNNAWVGQLRNNTPPGHTTMATGSFPRNDGILCFGWRDPIANKGGLPTSWEKVTAGEMTRLIAESGTTSIGTLYKKAHPQAKVAAISCEKYYAATGLGAESADYILFNQSQTPGRNLSPTGVKGHLAPDVIMNDQQLRRTKTDNWDGDTWAVDLALKILEHEKPEIMFINLPWTDEAGHATGGITAPQVMGRAVSNADRQIGRLIDAYKNAGIYDKTLFVITADHGMTPSSHSISQSAINSIIAQSGTSGNEANEFYLNNPGKAAEVAENIVKANIPGIQGAYYCQKSSDGGYVYLPSLTTEKNIAGDLDKCYRYLTSTYASEKSPDVFLIIAENWRQDSTTFKGSHDTVTWLTQHIPLIISGPGVRKGVVLDSPARLVDIAPTVLALMGIEPEHMDGIILADAIASSTPQQVQSQQKVNQELAPLAAALKARSEADLAAK
jgi:predicted AlkP superfamily pyrophosphatase or phosphodiesterase